MGLQNVFDLTRWNPLNAARPYSKPYNQQKCARSSAGPAGYTLAHHLSSEGFGVVAVDGLKIEPLDAKLVGGQLVNEQRVAPLLQSKISRRCTKN